MLGRCPGGHCRPVLSPTIEAATPSISLRHLLIDGIAMKAHFQTRVFFPDVEHLDVKELLA